MIPVAALSQLGLIDEYRLVVTPVILGVGTPIFKKVRLSGMLHISRRRNPCRT